jgi:DNA-binding transcriptional regulator YdaS (Cro superfamily)
MPPATASDVLQPDESMLLALRAAIKVAGSMRALAHLIGVTPAAVAQWDCVPAKRVVDVERATGVPREQLRPDLYRHTRIDEAIAFIKAAGYRVSKPRTSKRPKPKDRVGPTFVAEFADGTVTRMSTFTSLEKLDWERGERLSQAAYQSRWRVRQRKQHPNLVDSIAPVPPAIISARFEQDGKVLGARP